MRRLISCIPLVTLPLLLRTFPCLASDPADIGRVKTANGPAFILRQSQQMPATVGMKLAVSDVLKTGSGGSLGITMRDNSMLSIGPNSRLELSSFEFDPHEKKTGFVCSITSGTMVYTSGLIARLNRDAVKIKTPVAVAGVKGTTLGISVEGGGNE